MDRKSPLDWIVSIVATLGIVLIAIGLVASIVFGSLSHTRHSHSEVSVIRIQTNLVFPDVNNLTDATTGSILSPPPAKNSSTTAKIFPPVIPINEEPREQATLSVGVSGVGGSSALTMLLELVVPSGTNLPVGPKTSILNRISGYTNPTIVLLHSFVEQSGRIAFKELIPLLADEFSVLFPDMRGFGSSKGVFADYSLSQNKKHINLTSLVLDLRVVLDQVQGLSTPEQRNQSVVLVASDLVSGFVAYTFAAKYPQYLKGLVTIQCPHPNSFVEVLKREDQREQLYTKNRVLSILTAPGVKISDKVKQLSADNYNVLVQQVNTTDVQQARFLANANSYYAQWDVNSLKAQAAIVLDLFKPTTNETVEGPEQFLNVETKFADETLKIEVPTLAIYSTNTHNKDGVLYPENYLAMEKYFTNIISKPFDDASEYVAHEKPEDVAAAIKEFITKLY